MQIQFYEVDSFLIVGIGASAGGVQALQAFFEAAPKNSGIAYVVLLHLSPDHDSQLAQVLRHSTEMSVTQVTEKTQIKPNHVYVIPPNKHLEMEDGHLLVSQNTDIAERRAPVDIFFRSLAESHHSHSIGVVLSGTGANGSMGLKRIKERGGAVFVQSPREAEFSEMPRNAIATNMVDEVLTVGSIPAKIVAYGRSLGSIQIPEEQKDRQDDDQQALKAVLTELRLRTGHDFSNYKRPTLLRRIERRIHVYSLSGLPAYAAYLLEHPAEVQSLLKDLLISVTNFFRDGKPFEELQAVQLPQLLQNKTSEDQIRIWVAGCATGEEAYTIAMICADLLLGMVDVPKIQIFATDIDDAAIAVAREGYYTLNDAADISQERLNRYFTKEGEGYRIRRELRELILFASHNFLKDSPFSRIDLVSCRNVLIYLNRAAQERVFETFHFALRPGGFLLLGASESIDGSNGLFSVFNREQHIWQSRQVVSRTIIVPESIPRLELPQLPVKAVSERRMQERVSFGELHLQMVELYAPPSLIVNEDYDIVHISEHAGRYLNFVGGEPTQSLLKVVREEFRSELRGALYEAGQRLMPVSALGLTIRTGENTETLNIHVRPVPERAEAGARGFMLVVFEPVAEHATELPYVVASDEPAKQLEKEVTRLKGQLRTSNEQHEFAAEELKAGNEELQAMNEELRSATEELETSKEELQSINEELSTVNQELKVKVEESSMTSNNLRNIINSTDIGTIILDRAFRVILFTPAARSIFNLIAADQARPLSDITNRLRDDNLVKNAEQVLQTLQSIEREMETIDGCTYLTRLTPYRTEEDRIQGVVISFVDITTRKKTESALRESEEWRKLILESAEDYAIFTLTLERKLNSWNIGAQNIFGYKDEEIIGKLGDLLFVPEDQEKGDPAMEADRALKEGRAENERWHMRKDGSRFWGSGLVHPLRDDNGTPIGFVKIMRDLTAQKRIEESKFFLAAVVESSEDSVITVDFNHIITSWNKAAEWLFGYVAAEVLGKPMTMLTLPEDLGIILENIDDIQHSQVVKKFDAVQVRKGGELIDLEIVMSPVNNDKGEMIGISIIARNITKEKIRIANLAFLGEVSENLVRLTDIDETMNALSEKIGEYFKVSACLFANVNEAEKTIDAKYGWHREGVPNLKGVYQYDDFYTEKFRRESLAGKVYVVRNGVPNMLVNSSSSAFRGMAAYISVPLVRANEWLFNLTIYNTVPRNWREDEIVLLQELMTRIWAWVERGHAEEALRKSEEKYRTLFYSIDQGFCTVEVIFDDDGKPVDYRFLDANPAFGKHTGLNDAIRKTVRELVPEHDGYWFDLYGRVAQTGESSYFESRADALGRTYDVYAFPLGNSETNRVGILLNNITDRKKGEEALRISEERYRIALVSAGMAAWDWDAYADRVVWNDQHFFLLGLQPDGVEKNAAFFMSFVHTEDAAAVEAELRRSVVEEAPYRAEFRIVRADNGETRWMSGFGRAVIRDNNGHATRMVGVMYDITPHKRAEQQKEEFIGIASHELRTPVTSIKAYAEMLQEIFEESGDLHNAALMQKLDTQVDRLTTLIYALLDTTRISEGKFQLLKSSFNIDELIVDTAETMQRTAGSLQITLELKSGAVVFADQERIRQVMINLIGNAIKYAPGTSEIIVRSTLDNGQVTVCVQDFGIGVDELAQQQVFDRFFRSTEANTFSGLGLGLFISATIVRQHGGTISVQSRKGAGAIFCFTIPIGV